MAKTQISIVVDDTTEVFAVHLAEWGAEHSALVIIGDGVQMYGPTDVLLRVFAEARDKVDRVIADRGAKERWGQWNQWTERRGGRAS